MSDAKPSAPPVAVHPAQRAFLIVASTAQEAAQQLAIGEHDRARLVEECKAQKARADALDAALQAERAAFAAYRASHPAKARR